MIKIVTLVLFLYFVFLFFTIFVLFFSFSVSCSNLSWPPTLSPRLSNCHVSSNLINLEIILGDTYLHLIHLNFSQFIVYCV